MLNDFRFTTHVFLIMLHKTQWGRNEAALWTTSQRTTPRGAAVGERCVVHIFVSESGRMEESNFSSPQHSHQTCADRNQRRKDNQTVTHPTETDLPASQTSVACVAIAFAQERISYYTLV